MKEKSYSLIAAVAVFVLIQQLIFWWVAPTTATAYLTVCVGGTALSVGVPAVYVATYLLSNLRKSAGVAVVSVILETAVIALSALLLALDASAESAVFALVIAALLCFAILIPFVAAALKRERQGVYPTVTTLETMNTGTDS